MHGIGPCHVRKNTRSLKAKLSLNQSNQIKEVPPERGAFQTPQGESLGQNEKSELGHSGDKETKPTQDKKIEFRYSLSLQSICQVDRIIGSPVDSVVLLACWKEENSILVYLRNLVRRTTR